MSTVLWIIGFLVITELMRFVVIALGLGEPRD